MATGDGVKPITSRVHREWHRPSFLHISAELSQRCLVFTHTPTIPRDTQHMQEWFQLGTGFPEQLWERLFTEFREKGGSLLMATEHQPIRSWIPDSAIIIALITFGAYFVAFTHELGFCHYLNIPYQFISMNLNIIWYTSLPLIYAISMIFFGSIITVIVTFMGQRILRFISALVPQGMRDHVELESAEAATAPRLYYPIKQYTSVLLPQYSQDSCSS
jgi:hypothetical protein